MTDFFLWDINKETKGKDNFNMSLSVTEVISQSHSRFKILGNNTKLDSTEIQERMQDKLKERK
jgi:hypothetical protein